MAVPAFSQIGMKAMDRTACRNGNAGRAPSRGSKAVRWFSGGSPELGATPAQAGSVPLSGWCPRPGSNQHAVAGNRF